MKRVKSIIWGSRKRRVVSALAVLSLVISSVALAAWLTSGSGQAGAQFGALTTVSLTAGVGDPAYPGQNSMITSNLDNSNAQALTIVSATKTGNPTTSDATCNASIASTTFTPNASFPVGEIGVGNTPNVPLGYISIPAGASSACQGLDISVPVSVTLSN